YLSLYEAKMVHHFDHRWATYDGVDIRDLTLAEKQNPERVVCGRYWVHETDVTAALAGSGWNRDWLLGWRDICRSTDERTVIASIVPRVGVGNKIPLMVGRGGEPEPLACLSANLAELAY